MPPRKRAAPAADPDDPDFSLKKKSKAAKPKDGKELVKPAKAKADPELAALRYLLSDASKELILSKDRKDERMITTGRTYRSEPGMLSPFEELLCAVILAKPISHRLGVRTIAVLLNKPYAFNTPEALQAANEEKKAQALEDAHTQHRQKTVAQLETLAKVVIDSFADSPTDTSLSRLGEEGSNNPDEMSDLITASVKGISGLGIGIFYRRLQAYDDFSIIYPSADDRSLDACDEFGLPSESAEDLSSLLETHREALNIGAKEVEIRKAFATVLDRAVAISLDRQVGAAKKAIGK